MCTAGSSNIGETTMGRLVYFLVISSLFGSSISVSNGDFRDLNRKFDLFRASWHLEVGNLKFEMLDLRNQLESERARADRLEGLLNATGSVPETDTSAHKDIVKGEDADISLAEDACFAIIKRAFEDEKERARAFESTVTQNFTTGSDTTSSLKSDVEQLRRALAANSQKCARDIEDVNSTLNHIHGVAGVSNDTIADLQQNLQLAQVETKKTSEQLKQVLHKVTQQGNARETFRTPTVVFALRGAYSNYIYKGTRLRFRTTMSNFGGGYDSNTGIFTAPYAGTYLFHTTVCAHVEKWVYVNVVANYKTLATTGVYNEDARGSCSSAMGIAVLARWQRAWIEGAWDESGNALYTDGRFSTPTFTGVLLQKA